MRVFRFFLDLFSFEFWGRVCRLRGGIISFFVLRGLFMFVGVENYWIGVFSILFGV